MKTDWSRVALGVAIGGFVAYQQFKLPPILPQFLAEHPHDAVTAAGFMSVYALVGLLASAAIGHWLTPGRQRGAIPLLCLLAALGGALSLAWPASAAAMLTGRGIEGLSFAIGAIAGPAIASSGASPRDLPLVNGLLAGWIPIGQILAALIALGPIDRPGGWQLLWWCGLALCAPLALWGWIGLRGRRDGAGTAQRPQALAPDARQRRSLMLNGGIFMLWSAQYFAFMTWLTQYLTVELHLGADMAVAAYLLPVVVLLICNVLWGWALKHGAPLQASLLVAILAQAGIWLLAPYLQGVGGLVALAVYGAAAGVTPTCLFHMPHVIQNGHAGAKALGIVMTGRNLGVFLGPIILALLIERGPGWSGGSLVMAGMTVLSATLAALLARRLRSGARLKA